MYNIPENMVYKKLGKYLDGYDPVMVRGSGFTATKLKPLIELNIVKMAKLPGKTGKLPVKPNSFVLTDFGRSVVRSALSKTISSSEVVAKASQTLSAVRKELREYKEKISGLEVTLQNIDNNLSRQVQVSITQKSQEITEGDIISLIRNAQRKASSKQKLGNLFSVDIYFRSIQGRSGSSRDQINSLLYKLYQKNILDLQLGPGKKGEFAVTTPSGKKFHWGQLLS